MGLLVVVLRPISPLCLGGVIFNIFKAVVEGGIVEVVVVSRRE